MANVNEIIESPAEFVTHRDDPDVLASGTGVRFGRDATFLFSYEDRNLGLIENAPQINSSPYIGNQQIDILRYNLDPVHTAYYSGSALRSFTFTEQDNIDVFGNYSGNFAIKSYIDDPSSNNATHKAIYRTYVNVPIIASAVVRDASGVFLYDNYSPLGSGKTVFSGDNLSTASIDERTGNRDNITGPSGHPVTGAIIIDINYSGDPLYTRYDRVDIYATTGIYHSNPVGMPAATANNFIRSVPTIYQSKRQRIQIYPDDLQISSGNVDVNYNLTIVPYSKGGSGVHFGLGPHSFGDLSLPDSVVDADRIELNPLLTDSITTSHTRKGEASIYFKTGYITSTATTKIDVIPLGVHHNIHYMCKVQDSACNVYTTNIMSTLTHCTGGDHETQEYGQSADNYSTRPEFCVTRDADSTNAFLTVKMDSNTPYEWSIYRTSI